VQNPMDTVRSARLVELAKTLISIPSVTNQEHQIADWAYKHFKSIGLSDVHRFPVQDSGDSVIGWVDGPVQGPTLMFNFHLDTFPVCDGWNTDPFTPHLENGRLYGLGSHDMKGGGACALAAVEAIISSSIELGGRLILSATTDEENWSRGAHALIDSGLLDGCQYCLIPEPSFPATLTVGARGRHVFRLTFHGRTSHAAYGDQGINAVLDAAQAIAGLEEIDLGFDNEFGLSGSLCVIGFHGGGTLILVPEEAHVHIDRHILPGQTVKEAAAQIETAVQRAGVASTYELTWDERPTPAPLPYVVPSDSSLVQTVRRNMERELDQPVKLFLQRSVADTNHFAVYGRIPTLVWGPQGGNTCQANEYVEVDSMPAVTRTYIQTAIDLLGVRS
jgi:acetylornithine deacetylase/succinyl-diaminopimelate desuccinylase-like protein